jgi:hypothetical protein
MVRCHGWHEITCRFNSYVGIIGDCHCRSCYGISAWAVINNDLLFGFRQLYFVEWSYWRIQCRSADDCRSSNHRPSWYQVPELLSWTIFWSAPIDSRSWNYWNNNTICRGIYRKISVSVSWNISKDFSVGKGHFSLKRMSSPIFKK